MSDKRETNLPLALLWQDYLAARRAATTARELYFSLKTNRSVVRPKYPAAIAEGGRRCNIHTPTTSIEFSFARADREWRAAQERLVRIRDAVATAPIRSQADAMIKARFLNEGIADTLGEPWDTAWWQLNDWLS